jgi:hypothetical protein
MVDDTSFKRCEGHGEHPAVDAVAVALNPGAARRR